MRRGRKGRGPPIRTTTINPPPAANSSFHLANDNIIITLMSLNRSCYTRTGYDNNGCDRTVPSGQRQCVTQFSSTINSTLVTEVSQQVQFSRGKRYQLIASSTVRPKLNVITLTQYSTMRYKHCTLAICPFHRLG